jgi:hypothetical protein
MNVLRCISIVSDVTDTEIGAMAHMQHAWTGSDMNMDMIHFPYSVHSL